MPSFFEIVYTDILTDIAGSEERSR